MFPAPSNKSHRRYNPLTQEWILVSPNRISRPWGGAVEEIQSECTSKKSKPDTRDQATNNHLAPGAVRANGVINPIYEGTYTFKNDFPALSARNEDSVHQVNLAKCPIQARIEDSLFAWAPATGECHVMCFDPRPDLRMALMTHTEIVNVINEWCKIITDSKNRGFQWAQIFENRGDMMGCSNPHPHCQIWMSDFLPSLVIRRDLSQRDYFTRIPGHVLLVDYVNYELDLMSTSVPEDGNNRIVVLNADWVCLVPWWASWPFETLLLPRRRQILRLDDLSTEERSSLAEVLSRILTCYDNLFHTSCPYSFGWYQTPLQMEEAEGAHWQLHATFLPPLLRSATVKKHMVGYELLAETQRDLMPEKAASMLRTVDGPHYLRFS